MGGDMDEEGLKEIAANVAAFSPDQTLPEIFERLAEAMAACSKKLDSQEMGMFIAIAAAIYRLGEGKKRWREAK
jgi:hypothetical protein